MTNDVEHLTARLERAANQPDRGLWRDINSFAYARGWIDDVTVIRNIALIEITGDENVLIPVALSLVPEGWTWLCGDGGIMKGRPADPRFGAICFRSGNPDQEATSGTSPAIALCIAVLKARQRGAQP